MKFGRNIENFGVESVQSVTSSDYSLAGGGGIFCGSLCSRNKNE